jgi:hypothetical protein
MTKLCTLIVTRFWWSWVQRSWFSYELSSLRWPWKYSDDQRTYLTWTMLKEVYFNKNQINWNRIALLFCGGWCSRQKKILLQLWYNSAFKDAGMEYYNEIILVNVVGSACGACDVNSMVVVKLVRCIKTFYKGDPKKDKKKTILN